MAKTVARLREKSSLTALQLQTLLLHRSVESGEIRVVDALQSGRKVAVSPGSYYRVLDQARNNLRSAIFTLLLGVKLGIIAKEPLNKLLGMLAEVPDDMSDASLDELMSAVSAIVQRIVTG